MQSRSTDSRDTGDAELARRVIDAVASAEGVAADDLQPLTRSVDPDALNALFGGEAASTGKAVFRYHGYVVTVHGDGRIALDERLEP